MGKMPDRFPWRAMDRICSAVLRCVTHAAVETNSVTCSWRSVLLLRLFSRRFGTMKTPFFWHIEFCLPADKFAFEAISVVSALNRMHWTVFVIEKVCIALAFVVYVDGGGHIYLSFSPYSARCCCYYCHTTAFVCTQRMYYKLGRLNSKY